MKYTWHHILVIIFFITWFLKYFIDILLGKLGFFLTLAGILIWLFLGVYAMYLILKYLIADTNTKPNVNILWLIIPMLTISLFNPNGLINWEKLENKNLLIASYEGTANCRTYIKLRENNECKIYTYCFGTEIAYGNYSISKDTIYFDLHDEISYFRKRSFGILGKRNHSDTKYNDICIYIDKIKMHCLSFRIIEQSDDFEL